jgi:hypothetical protein
MLCLHVVCCVYVVVHVVVFMLISMFAAFVCVQFNKVFPSGKPPELQVVDIEKPQIKNNGEELEYLDC